MRQVKAFESILLLLWIKKIKSSTLKISKYKKKILMVKVHLIAEVRDEEEGILPPRSNWDLSPQ
ncbi:MAG TPA: hypothetical protein VE619_10455 [Nitrososphaeraceae archaeon]|jgi:hypothetical protein|nr:hypothetical protein [Nitrososphaeraceae archaeon]